MTITVDNLEFRVKNGLMPPHEVFFAMARKHFDDGEYDRSIALIHAFKTFDGADSHALKMIQDISAKGFTARDISPEVAQVVREETDIFKSIPDEIRNKKISPRSYIAIHPFEARKEPQDKWILKNQEQVRTRIVKKGDELWNRCERLEYEVFVAPDMQYYPENTDLRIPDFDHFSNQEFIAASKGSKIIGVMRLLYSDAKHLSEGMFQTFDHREELHMFPEMVKYLESLDPRQIVDMSTMAITFAERDSLASKALITRTMQRIWETGRQHALASIDTPFYRKLKSRALDFQDLGPSTFYWGSPTTACLLDTYTIPKGMSKLFIPYFKTRGFFERILANRRH